MPPKMLLSRFDLTSGVWEWKPVGALSDLVSWKQALSSWRRTEVWLWQLAQSFEKTLATSNSDLTNPKLEAGTRLFIKAQCLFSGFDWS